MYDEGFAPAEGIVSAAVPLWPVVRSFGRRQVRHVVSNPFLPIRVPPNQFLSLAPRRTIRSSRSAIVENTAIAWPRISPAMPVKIFRLALSCQILPGLGKDARVNPASAGRRTIGLQVSEARDQTPASSFIERPAVDLLEHFFHSRLTDRPFQRVIPSQCVKPRILAGGIFSRSFLQPSPQMIDKPRLAASIPRRVDGLFVKLVQTLRVGEASLFLGVTRGGKNKYLRVHHPPGGFPTLHLR